MSITAGGKILVTGADGFIGSHLTEALLAQGYDVRAFCLYNSFGHRGWLDTLPESVTNSLDVFMGDIRDPHGVKTAMQGCHTVLHLAALIAIPYSYHSPTNYVDTNITGTLNILQAARELEVEKIIHTSTSEVYGTARSVPITEQHVLQPQSPYSATKIGADQLALSFYHAFDTPVSIIRPFNTYGPRQSMRAVIPTIIMQLLSGKQHIELGATHPTRDFNFVEDTVQGFVAAAKAKSIAGEVINLSSNYEISIAEVAQTISNVLSVPLSIESDAVRMRPESSEVDRLWGCNEKAKRLLGWTPSFAGLDGFKRGIENTTQWFKMPENQAYYRANQYQI